MSHDEFSERVTPTPRRPCRRWDLVISAALVLLVGLVFPKPIAADTDDDYTLALQFYKQDRWDFAAAKLRQFLTNAPPDHDKVPLAKLYLGQALVHQRQFKEARPVFRDFVAKHPQQQDVALAMYRIGECSYFLNDFPAAQKELRAFLDQVPADHALAEWALQYLGETELNLDRPQEAIRSFEAGLTRFEKGRLSEEMQFGLARAYERSNRSAEASRIYERLAKEGGRRAADADFNLAARLFDEKQYEPAADRFTAVARKHDGHRIAPLASLNAGYSYYHLGRFQDAMAQFKAVADDEKLGSTAGYWMGLSLKSQGRFDEAGDGLTALHEANKEHPLAESMLFHAADSRLGAKRYAEALRLFRDVADAWPNGDLADDSLHLATEAALLAGDKDAAEELHRQFKEQFPNSGLHVQQDLLWGRLLLAEGDQLTGEAAKQKYRDAAATFSEVANRSKIPESQSLATLQLARSWDRLENPSQVLKTLQPLLEQVDGPNRSDQALKAVVMQSTALLTLGKYEESAAAANRYLAINADGIDAADALANVSVAEARQGNWDSAEQSLKRLQATGRRTLSDRMSYEIAEIAYDAKQWTVAESLYRRVVENRTSGEFYRPALSGLAYCLHQEGRILQQQAEQATADSGDGAGTSKLAAAISRFDEAALWFSKLSDAGGPTLDPVVHSDALYMQGLSLRMARRRQLAVQALMDAVQRYSLPADLKKPDDTQTKAAFNAYRSAREAARTYLDLQEIESADRAYQIAYEQLQRQPAERGGGADALLNEWALMHYNAQAFDRANELFEKLVEEQPNSSWADDAQMLLAESDYFAQKYDSAREAFRELIGQDTTDAFVRERSLLLLMDVAVKLDDWKDAAAMADRLAKRFPDSEHRWEAAYRRGEAKLRLNQHAEAAQIFGGLVQQRNDTSLKEESWFPGTWLMLAEAQLRLQQYDRLKDTVAQFGELFPESPLQYHLDDVHGRALQKQARFEEARAAFSRVIDSPHGKGTETAAKAQTFIADSFLLEQNYEKAFEAYYLVQQYGFPEMQAAALLQAGKCEEELKRWQGAAKSYRKMLEEFSDSDYADEAKRRLKAIETRFPQTVGS